MPAFRYEIFKLEVNGALKIKQLRFSTTQINGFKRVLICLIAAQIHDNKSKKR